MADFAGMDELSQQRIAQLEEQLARAQEEAVVGQNAIAIVNRGIKKGGSSSGRTAASWAPSAAPTPPTSLATWKSSE